MKTADLNEYRQFASGAEFQKSINTLRGMVAGVKANGNFSSDEAMELAHWCSLHENFEKRPPFNEIIPIVRDAIEDGVIDEEEKQSILWVCDKLTGGFGEYYDDIAFSIQYLNGLVHGMLADGELSDSEILALKKWLGENEFLQGTYPFDELTSLVSVIIADKLITAEERETLMGFLGNIVEFKNSYNLRESDFTKLREKYSVEGICALCPEIEFQGKTFVITGESYHCSRAEMAKTIEDLGGTCRSSVTRKTD